MKLQSIPKSRAKTAYGLLSEVKRLIVEEPKRYNQGIDIRSANDSGRPLENFPACGMIGCVAGWVVVIKCERILPTYQIAEKATKILGLRPEQADELMDSCALEDYTKKELPTEGTRAYAKLGARHITRFQKKYARQLKAKRV